MKLCQCGNEATLHREYADGSCDDSCKEHDPCRLSDFGRIILEECKREGTPVTVVTIEEVK